MIVGRLDIKIWISYIQNELKIDAHSIYIGDITEYDNFNFEENLQINK